MGREFGWLDVERIGEELADLYASVDPLTVRFVDLRRMVEELPGFHPEAAHPVNEKILEAIQAAWHAEREDTRRDDE